MNDVRVSDNGSFALIELMTERARNWYANNVEGAPAVSSWSLTIDSGPAANLVRKMVKAGLIVVKAGEDDRIQSEPSSSDMQVSASIMRTNSNGQDTFWFVLKMFVMTYVLCASIYGIRDLAQVRGITGDSTPLIVALIVSVVLLYWAYEVVWTPVTPKPIVSVNTDSPVLFGDWVLFAINIAIIILASFCVADAIAPDKHRMQVFIFLLLCASQGTGNVKGVSK